MVIVNFILHLGDSLQDQLKRHMLSSHELKLFAVLSIMFSNTTLTETQHG